MATVFPIDPLDFTSQQYSSKDTNLINVSSIDTSLIDSSVIEFYIFDLNKNLVYSQENYTAYRVQNDGIGYSGGSNATNAFNINPGDDIQNAGYNEGDYIAYYNFLVKRVGDVFSPLFISEISSDRTEIRLSSTQLTGEEIIQQTIDFISFRDNQSYFVDFYLNFGSNQLTIANNILLKGEDTSSPSVLIKLYEPLPDSLDLKDSLFIVTTLNEPEAFQVEIPPVVTPVSDSFQIAGPNFSLPIKDEVNNSSLKLSYNDIINGASTGSQNQIDSLLSQSAINISIDYNNFSDYIYFSSAKTRIENFYYKVGLIESYTSESAVLSNVTSSTTSKIILENKVSNIIKNFDKFEYYMYYTSGSQEDNPIAYPKSTSELPYTLYSTTSSQALTWLGSEDINSAYFGGLATASANYDNVNQNELKKAIPEYIREDSNNQLYDLFVDMVAQYYDNVWMYTKDITQKYNADNRIDFGVSKDLVADALKDFGIKLYQNNFSNKDLYTNFLGITPEGSTFPFPEITGSGPASTGMEIVDTLISASNDIIPMDDVNKSLYKRFYHNVPYLLKSKGTIAGLRALITSYGIPDTILKISEFGGKDQVNANDYDLYDNNFNYALEVGPNVNFITSSWKVNEAWNSPNNVPSTVQFRFKAEDILPTNLTQSLFGIKKDGYDFESLLQLEYSGSGLSTNSYGGATLDPYYQYAHLKWIPNITSGHSASVYLPFFDEGWWSVMITSGSTDGFKLTAANKIYNGKDGTSIGFISSSTVNTGSWNDILASAYFATSSYSNDITVPFQNPSFSGSLQEIRYYNQALSESVFKDYVMNPLSTEGNGVNSAPSQLIFRADLGSELETTPTTAKTKTSIHPKVTGSFEALTSSFDGSSNYHLFNSRAYPIGTYNTNTEIIFLDQPAAGIKNRITDKIRSESDTLASGNVLSPMRSLSQNIEASASYTDNINYLEVAFSPQNQINDDIIGQMGHFNIGDYIGDPRQRFSHNSSGSLIRSTSDIYPDLNNLSEDYFKKYIKQYDLKDFVRLIKFFDNSLFKMIKDFIPTRTSLASGIVTKQHLLERNKYPQPAMSFEDKIHSGSINMYHISGGAAGMFNEFNSTTTSPSGSLGQGPDNIFNITQSWNETYPTISGSVTKLHDSQDEFYDGEFSGSIVEVTNGELNPGCDPFKEPTASTLRYAIRHYNEFSSSLSSQNQITSNQFINTRNQPLPGYLSTCFGSEVNNPTFFGITDIKISKFDVTGENKRDELVNLDILTLIFKGYSGGPSVGDVTSLNFNILLKQEFDQYIYFRVENSSNTPKNTGPFFTIPGATRIYPDIPIPCRVIAPQMFSTKKEYFTFRSANSIVETATPV